MHTLSSRTLPLALFRAEQSRELDRLAIDEHHIPGYTLMTRAGEAAFRVLCTYWPRAKRIAVVCGTGNNGGDGFVLARLAHEQGLRVDVIQLGDGKALRGDALQAWKDYETAGGSRTSYDSLLIEAADVIVDAVFGTGFEREVSGEWAAAIEMMNECPVPVLALDLPSGLNSDSGMVMGAAVHADVTTTFISLKQGQFTASGPAYCGEIVYDSLEVPHEVFLHVTPSATRISNEILKRLLWKRPHDTHKGENGHVLIIGGNYGMAGAVRMAGEAALRVGAGLVSVATRKEHIAAIIGPCPELMTHVVETTADLAPLLNKADVVAIGPGLGTDNWGVALLGKVMESGLPLVVDADALNLLAKEPSQRGNWILTPHPGEAARLLNQTTDDIQQDRFAAIKALVKNYAGVMVLKGSGTLVYAYDSAMYVCDAGNPGMATGGVGDILTGVIAALAAQGLELEDAARAGVFAHSTAADCATAVNGERGMIATDLLPHLRKLVNPQT